MKRGLLTPEIQEQILETYDKLKSIRKTQDAVNQLLGISLTFHNVRNIINWTENDLKEIKWVLEEMNEDIAWVQRYEIKDEDYILTHKWLNKVFKINIALVDEIFKDYSRHGNNLSWEDILRKYKIKPEVFSLIKNKLRLYKASDVISPYTAENLPEEELDTKIHEAIDENISRTKNKMINTFEKQFKKEALKAMSQVWNFEYQLEAIKKAVSNYNPRVFEFPSLTLENSKEKDFIITDLHIWKKNSDRILSDLNKIKEVAINSPEQHINIICLWDLWENFSQTPMHSGQHISLDRNILTDPFELQIYIADVFYNFLTELRKANKKVKFIWLTWNHDRTTSKNEDDLSRQAGRTIYTILEVKAAQLDIEVKHFKEAINTFSTEYRNYILSHWEYNFNKKKPEDILWKYWTQDKFNLILSGHTHQNKQEVWYNYAKIVVSPLAGPNDYDERLGLKGEVWFTTIKDSEVWGIEISNVIIRTNED